jgi:hypothetical protein
MNGVASLYRATTPQMRGKVFLLTEYTQSCDICIHPSDSMSARLVNETLVRLRFRKYDIKAHAKKYTITQAAKHLGNEFGEKG